MGVNITQYRQAIGLFNGAKLIKLSSGISIALLHLTLVITFIVLLLLLLCMDVDRNPGPVPPKLSKLNICHANVRGLSQSKLRDIQTSHCDQYHVVTFK